MLDARCWVLNAFDVARAISLPRCREALTTREVAAPRRPEWPHLFGLDQRPLVWSPEPTTLTLGGVALEFQPRAIIYDFGNVSVALGCRVVGTLAQMRATSVALRNAPVVMSPAIPGMGNRYRVEADSNGVSVRNANIHDLVAIAERDDLEALVGKGQLDHALDGDTVIGQQQRVAHGGERSHGRW